MAASLADGYPQHGLLSSEREPPRGKRLCENSCNTTHGSGWMVQVLPTQGRTQESRFSLLSPS
ncbi:MAG TPA: hypothetical protein VI837_10815, partial [Blastocatellia bacterium]|nr:hypothetical protein [Blastocatellia bacterium]